MNNYVKKTGFLLGLFTFGVVSCANVDLQHEKILICGTGKNIAHALPNMIAKIEGLGAQFLDYRVIMYQNNSTDATEKLLRQWEQRNKRVIVFSENLTPEQLHVRTKGHAKRDQAPNRMELIAYGRNRTLEKALSEEFNDYKYLVMCDMDFTVGWEVKGVLSCFDYDFPWDCMTANGLAGSSYYDRYAYHDERCPLGPEMIGEPFWQDFGRTAVHFSVNDQPKKVISAFGGVGVYKREAMKGCEYSGYVTEDFTQWMSAIINSDWFKNSYQYKQYREIIGLKNASRDAVLPVVYQANCGYDSFVMIDHAGLHASMIVRGYDKIYVNPKMICRY